MNVKKNTALSLSDLCKRNLIACVHSLYLHSGRNYVLTTVNNILYFIVFIFSRVHRWVGERRGEAHRRGHKITIEKSCKERQHRSHYNPDNPCVRDVSSPSLYMYVYTGVNPLEILFIWGDGPFIKQWRIPPQKKKINRIHSWLYASACVHEVWHKSDMPICSRCTVNLA